MDIRIILAVSYIALVIGAFIIIIFLLNKNNNIKTKIKSENKTDIELESLDKFIILLAQTMHTANELYDKAIKFNREYREHIKKRK